MGSPVVGREGDTPEFGGGLEEFDADFGFAFGGGSDVNYADELFFEGFDVADQDFLVESDAHGKGEECAVGADIGGEGVFGDVLLVGAAGDDEDGKTKEDALAAAAVGDGSVVGRRIGHGGDGLGNSVGEEEGGVKRRKVLKFQRERDGPGGGSRTHTGSDPRQILSLLRLPVPPLRENL